MLLGFIIWLGCAIIAAMIASERGSSGFLWFIFGCFFGIIAVLLAFTCGKRCPFCASKISTKAIVCPKCQKSALGRKDEEVKKPTNSSEERLALPVHIIGDYTYVLLKDKKERAFCLGCRTSDDRNNLYYCEQKDEYYHLGCLPKN